MKVNRKVKKYLEIDVGNSFCKWRLVEGEKIITRGQISTKDIEGVETIKSAGEVEFTSKSRDWLLSQNGFASIIHEKLDGIYVCSVANDLCNTALVRIVKDVWGHEPKFFKAECQTAALKNSYQNPSKMGADRWLASLSAVSTYPNRNLYVIDCGSAINIEILSSDSIHQGGFIIPGVAMMQSTLLKNTAKVSRTLNEVSIEPGKETGANVANGSFLAALAVIEKLQRDAVEKKAILLLTGGDAKHLIKYLDMTTVEYQPDLVMDGFKYWRISLDKECLTS